MVVILVAGRLLKLKEILAALRRWLRLMVSGGGEGAFVKEFNSSDLVLFLDGPEIGLFGVWVRREDLGMLVFNTANLLLKHFDFVF